jgi:caffeoyl-CoA O-methyltransferase
MLERMQYMEAIDARDRLDGTPQTRRLRQITPETGRFIALLAASAPAGQVLEVGTSGGYSGLWLSLACRSRGDRLVTFDVLDNKVGLARETFAAAGVQDIVQVVLGDARRYLADYHQVAFCFIDTEKELYGNCYEIVIPNLVPGGWLVADNSISHAQELRSFIDRALKDERVDVIEIPLGKGLLTCRKI